MTIVFLSVISRNVPYDCRKKRNNHHCTVTLLYYKEFIVPKSTALAETECAHYKVLVVDDYAHIRQMLYEVLKDQGYHIMTAPNGEAALETLSSHNFDLVITDLNMGRVNGIEVLKKAKSLSPQPGVIIATGNSDVAYVIEALRCKADDYILKPFRIADLLDRISQYLSQRVPHSLNYC